MRSYALFVGITLVASTSPVANAQVGPLLSNSLRRVVPPAPLYSVVGAAGELDGNAAHGDIDADGDIDVVQGGRALLNDGDGVFTPSSCAPTTASWGARATTLADLDADGDLDLLQRGGPSHGSPDELQLWLNDGAGCFTYVAGQLLIQAGANDAEFDVGDVDGDGDLDVFVPRFHDLNLSEPALFLNSGTASFVDASHLVAGFGIDDHAAVDLADVDGDGDVDAFVYGDQSPNDGGEPNRFLINDGTGQFVVLSQVPPLAHSLEQLVDVDGDLDLDLWLSGSSLFLNDGSENFSDASSSLPSIGVHEQLVAVGDFDGDGDVDGVVSGERDSRTLINDGTGVFTALTERGPGRLRSGRAFDADGDADLDVFCGYCVLFNRGDGRFVVPPETLPRGPAIFRALAAADIDSDMDIDLFFAGDSLVTSSPRNRLLVNESSGVFAQALGGSLVVGDETFEVLFADLDGDGDPDLVTDPYETSLRVYVNDGSGAFTPAAPVLPHATGWGPLHAGDLDGDGDIDLLADGLSKPVLLNDGHANFTPSPTSWPTAPPYFESVALGDMDADGDLDVLAISFQAGAVALLNDGHASFTPVTTALPNSWSWYLRMWLGDVDADGDLDIVAASQGQTGHTLLGLNDGLGHFSDATAQLPQSAGSLQAIALVDFDLDGDLDIAVPRPLGELALLENDGSGHFVDGGTIAAAGSFGSVSPPLFLDLDFDGDLDLAMANNVLTNITRQVSWRTLPRVGRPLELELHGPPHEHFQLYASLRGAHLPFGATGTLLIDRSHIVMNASGVFDATGAAIVHRDLSSDPALIGLTLYWQALISNPRRLTNLEVTVLGNY